MDDEIFIFNHLTIYAAWAGILAVSLYVLIVEYMKEEAKKKQIAEHRRIQNEEWQAQLRRYPWLGRVISSTERLDVALIVTRRPNGSLDIELAPEEEPKERVQWKKEGF